MFALRTRADALRSLRFSSNCPVYVADSYYIPCTALPSGVSLRSLFPTVFFFFSIATSSGETGEGKG